jgi:hypothetical protein
VAPRIARRAAHCPPHLPGAFASWSPGSARRPSLTDAALPPSTPPLREWDNRVRAGRWCLSGRPGPICEQPLGPRMHDRGGKCLIHSYGGSACERLLLRAIEGPEALRNGLGERGGVTAWVGQRVVLSSPRKGCKLPCLCVGTGTEPTRLQASSWVPAPSPPSSSMMMEDSTEGGSVLWLRPRELLRSE